MAPIKHLLWMAIVAASFAACKTHAPATAKAPKATSHLSAAQQVDFDRIFYNACAEKIKGNLDLSNDLYLQCIKIDPANATPYFEVAKYLNFKGDKVKAIEYAGKAAQLDPSNVWFKYYYAEYLVAKNQYAQAAEVYKQIAVLEPGKIEVLYEVAEMYIYSSQYADALKVYDQIEAKIGVNEEGSLQRIKIYSNQKNEDKVIKELNKLIKAFPKEAKYYGMLGESYENTGQGAKAIETFNELLKLDPTNPYVHLSLAQYYRAKRDEWTALHHYKLAFANEGLDIDTKMKVLLSYYTLTDSQPLYKDSVIAMCKVLAEVHPEEAKSYAILGDFLYRDKRYAEARDAFRQAIARDKTKYVIWNTMMITDSELNDADALLADSKQALALFPAEPLSYLFNGFANFQKKNYADAIAQYNEGKNLVVDNKPLIVQFNSSLGDVYASVKRYAASDSAYDSALQLDSNNVSVLNNYAYYLSLRKDKLDKALLMAKRVNDLQPNTDTYLDTYGWIFYQQANFENAKKYIGEALQKGGDTHGVILEHYGDVLYHLGDAAGALDYWGKAMQKGGGSEWLEKKLAEKKMYE